MSSFFVSSNVSPNQSASNLTTQIYPPILLPNLNYEVAIVGGSIVNSLANVSTSLNNNSFRYSPDNGTTWYTVNLPKGTYTTTGIQQQLQLALIANNNVTVSNGVNVYPITFSANLTFLKVQVQLNGGYEVDFSNGNLYQLLGYLPQIYAGGINGETFIAPNSAQFTNRSSFYMIYCDLIQGGLQNSIVPYGIMKIVPGGDLGYAISLVPTFNDIDYFQVKTQNITSINFMVLDAYGNIADLQGEPTSFQLRFRKITL